MQTLLVLLPVAGCAIISASLPDQLRVELQQATACCKCSGSHSQAHTEASYRIERSSIELRCSKSLRTGEPSRTWLSNHLLHNGAADSSIQASCSIGQSSVSPTSICEAVISLTILAFVLVLLETLVRQNRPLSNVKDEAFSRFWRFINRRSTPIFHDLLKLMGIQRLAIQVSRWRALRP